MHRNLLNQMTLLHIPFNAIGLIFWLQKEMQTKSAPYNIKNKWNLKIHYLKGTLFKHYYMHLGPFKHEF